MQCGQDDCVLSVHQPDPPLHLHSSLRRHIPDGCGCNGHCWTSTVSLEVGESPDAPKVRQAVHFYELLQNRFLAPVCAAAERLAQTEPDIM